MNDFADPGLSGDITIHKNMVFGRSCVSLRRQRICDTVRTRSLMATFQGQTAFQNEVFYLSENIEKYPYPVIRVFFIRNLVL